MKNVVKNKLKRKIELVNKRNEWLNQVVPRLKSYLEENEVKITKDSVHNMSGSLYKKHQKAMDYIIQKITKERIDDRIPEELEYYYSVTYCQLRLVVRIYQDGVEIIKRQFLASFNNEQGIERLPEYKSKKIDFTPQVLANNAEKIKQKNRAIKKLEDSISDLKMDFPTSIDWEDFYE